MSTTVLIPKKIDRNDVNLEWINWEDESIQEVHTTTLSSLGTKIGNGTHGEVFLLEKDPSIVLKFFYKRRLFIQESRIYLYAENYAKDPNNPSLPIPRFRGMYHIPSNLYDSLTLVECPEPYPFCLGISKIEGKTLFQAINDEEFREKDPKFLEETLKKGLQELHNAGIYHGDINSRNIIVDTTSWQASFVDFGFGILRDDQDCDWDFRCSTDHMWLVDMFKEIREYLEKRRKGTCKIGTYTKR